MDLKIEAQEGEKVKYYIDGIEITPPYEYYIKVSSKFPIEFWLTNQFKLQVVGNFLQADSCVIDGKKVKLIKNIEIVGVFFNDK